MKWTINGSTAEGGRFASYQILKDPVSSTYENILVVTGNVFGLFVCNVTTWSAPDIYHRSSAQSTNASLFVGGKQRGTGAMLCIWVQGVTKKGTCHEYGVM